MPQITHNRYNSDQDTEDEDSIEDYLNTPGKIDPQLVCT